MTLLSDNLTRGAWGALCAQHKTIYLNLFVRSNEKSATRNLACIVCLGLFSRCCPANESPSVNTSRSVQRNTNVYALNVSLEIFFNKIIMMSAHTTEYH